MNLDTAAAADSGRRDSRSRRGTDSDPSGTRSTVVVLCVFSVLIAVHATAWAGQLLYPVMVIAAAVAGTVGVRIHRAEVIWPWWMLVTAGVLWSVAGVARETFRSTGDLSSGRSLIPDLFSIPGYVAFGIGLWGLVHSHGADRDRSVLIDALLVAAGSAAIVFSLIISPTLNLAGSSFDARISVSVYPMISMFLLIGSAQLAFTRTRRAESFMLLVAGSACLTLGDLLYAMGETGSIDVPVNVLDLPYLAVAAFFSAAALHPDAHRVRGRASAMQAELGLGRMIAVTFAFLAPTVAVLAPAQGPGRPFQIGSCVMVTVLAVWRILVASRSEAALRSELIERATHDALTGLPSRQVVVDAAAALMNDPKRNATSLMFLDLDGFKLVNDSLGHAAGDHLLMLVADRLVDTVRADDVVGRIGGDEFVVVCADLDAHGARALGDRIRHALREPFDLDGNVVHVGASVGINVGTHGDDAETVMREADTAMYQSKEHGRNLTTVFDVPMREQISERIDVENGLRRAIDNNEFSVVFQPIVSTADRCVDGFEALMRWNSPTGVRGPGEFIPVAEDTGLIVAMGRWVLDEACRQVAHWRGTISDELTVSVNVSATQLQGARFVEEVAACLDRHALPGEALWLEIVETVMLDNSLSTTAVLMGLEELGVRLAVDDFGTGYASLTYLRQFPVARLKVDRSFVADMTTDSSTAALVGSVVSLACDLDIEVVAEGVETLDQQIRLIDMGCTLIQGFLHSAGVAAAEVPAMVETIEQQWPAAFPVGQIASRRTVRRPSRCRP